jgi:hypothetical protein
VESTKWVVLQLGRRLLTVKNKFVAKYYKGPQTWPVSGAGVRKKRKAYRTLAGKPEGKRPLGKQRCRWVDNIRMDTGWGGMDWINLAHDRNWWRAFVSMVMNLQV